MLTLKTRGYSFQALENDWARALDRRNYLIHRFFWDNAVRLNQADQCEALARELQELATLFALCQRAAQQVATQLVTSLGADPADWRAALRREFDRLFEKNS